MTMFDYPALAALSAVVREGSFERAASALHVTPSAVSQRIKQLEERAGCPLVVRGQPCHATAAGQQLIRHLDRVRLLEQEMQDVLPGAEASASRPWARLPIAINADSLATWAIDAIAAFAAAYPALLEVFTDDEAHTAEWLRNGQVLAAITASPTAVAGCNLLPLGSIRYVAAASPAFVGRYFAKGIDAGSLATAPCLVFNQKDTLQSRWAARIVDPLPDFPRHQLPSTEAFVTAAIAGMGWGMQPLSLIEEHLNSGALVELKARTPLDVPLYWQHSRLASRLLDRLTDTILKQARASLRRSGRSSSLKPEA